MKVALILGCLVLLLCGGLFFLLDVPTERVGVDPAPDPDPVPAPPTAAASPEPAPAPPPPSPSELDAEVPELIKQLGSWRRYYREKALKRLMELGPAARAALPAIEKLIETGKGRTMFYALVARMKIEESRRDYKRIAEEAAKTIRGGNQAVSAFYLLDPAHANGVKTAIRIRDVNWRNLPRPQGIEAFLEHMYESEAAGIAELGRRLVSATAAERGSWWAILREMRPLPAGVASVLGRALREGDDAHRNEVVSLLSGSKNDATALSEAMAPVVCELAATSDPAYRLKLVRVLGGLGADDAGSMEVLVGGLTGTRELSDASARSLARLGSKGAPAVDALLAAAKVREPGTRGALIGALLATRDRRALPFLRSILHGANAAERRLVLDRVSAVEGSVELAPDFFDIYADVPEADRSALVGAAVRSDLALTRKETSEILARGLAAARTRTSSLYLVARLTALTPEVVGGIVKALPHVRSARNAKPWREAILAAAKFGPEAGGLVPDLLPLADLLSVQSAVVRALATLLPVAPECVAVFRRLAVEGSSRTARLWAVRGLGETKAPVKKDVAALEGVMASKKDRYQSPARTAAEILKRPEWAALRSK